MHDLGDWKGTIKGETRNEIQYTKINLSSQNFALYHSQQGLCIGFSEIHEHLEKWRLPLLGLL